MPLRRLPFAFLVSLITACLPACGDSSTSGTGGTGGSGGGASSSSSSSSVSAPKSHRATAEACTAARPPGIDGATGGDCTSDADCTEGDNGRCVQDINNPPFCSYDECQSDADCGGGSVCECRNPAVFDANVCVHGNCLTDADCLGDYCSPSAVTLSPFCSLDIPIGSVGYFCHSAADECVNDDDCDPGTGSFPGCLFDADKGHFACREILCVN